jgi:hypothetical protein
MFACDHMHVSMYVMYMCPCMYVCEYFAHKCVFVCVCVTCYQDVLAALQTDSCFVLFRGFLHSMHTLALACMHFNNSLSAWKLLEIYLYVYVSSCIS